MICFPTNNNDRLQRDPRGPKLYAISENFNRPHTCSYPYWWEAGRENVLGLRMQSGRMLSRVPKSLSPSSVALSHIPLAVFFRRKKMRGPGYWAVLFLPTISKPSDRRRRGSHKHSSPKHVCIWTLEQKVVKIFQFLFKMHVKRFTLF